MLKRNLILFLLIAPMVTVMCDATYLFPMPPPPDASVYSLPSGLNCLTSGPVPEGEVTNQYTSCFLKCSSGAERTYVQQSEFDWDAESLQAKYCQAETVTPTATNTPASSVETSEPVVRQADPMLTGEVTMCDPENQLISLRIAEGVHVTQFQSLETTIGGQAVTCGVNPSNASLYTCDLPTPLLFPAQITVIGDGSTLNYFLFDGSSCISDKKPPNDASPEDTPAPPDCIAHPSDPGC